MLNFGSNISDEELEKTKIRREAILNKPTLDKGMEVESIDLRKDNSIVTADDFDSFGSHGSRGFDADDTHSFGAGMNQGRDFHSFGSHGFSAEYGYMDSQPICQESDTDKIFSTVSDGIKEFVNFMKDFICSFNDFNVFKRMAFGKNVMISGIAVAICALIFFILNGITFVEMLKLVVACLFCEAIGVIFFLFSFEAIGRGDYPKEEEVKENSEEEVVEETSDDEPKEVLEPEPEPIFFDDDDNWDRIEETQVETVVSSEPVDEYLQERIFLYEELTNVLESNSDDFSKTHVYEEGSRELLKYCSLINDASRAYTGKEECDDIQVIKVEEKLFYVLIQTTRPPWLRSEKACSDFANEILNICSFDESTYMKDESITASINYVGPKLFIKIMKGETALVTLKDMYSKVKSKVLSKDYKMPVVLGIDESGNVVIQDFVKIYAMLVAGAPRSGKSWCVKSILAQLMMYKSPKEMQFYLIDPKGSTSDFFTMEVPHIREFINDNDRVITLLKYLCKKEAHRREELLYKAGGYKNIEDYLKDNPNADIPYIYVVIDEVITVSQTMDKDMRKEFFNYLQQFVSRLPGYGIRLILVPHLVKNAVIDKTVTDMIPNRIIVKGTPDRIEAVLDVKEREFPYALAHTGDMAVKLGDNAKPGFVHSAILSTTNEGYDRYFDYLTNFWLKYYPDMYSGSKLQKDVRLGYRRKTDFPILEKIDTSNEYYQMPKPLNVRWIDSKEEKEKKQEQVKIESEEVSKIDAEKKEPAIPEGQLKVKMSSVCEKDEDNEKEVENMQVKVRPKRPVRKHNDNVEIIDLME